VKVLVGRRVAPLVWGYNVEWFQQAYRLVAPLGSWSESLSRVLSRIYVVLCCLLLSNRWQLAVD